MRHPVRPHSILEAPPPVATISPDGVRFSGRLPGAPTDPRGAAQLLARIVTGGIVQGKVHVHIWARLKPRGAPAGRGRHEGERSAGTHPAALKGDSRGRGSTTMVGHGRHAGSTTAASIRCTPRPGDCRERTYGNHVHCTLPWIPMRPVPPMRVRGLGKSCYLLCQGEAGPLAPCVLARRCVFPVSAIRASIQGGMGLCEESLPRYLQHTLRHPMRREHWALHVRCGVWRRAPSM